MYSVPMEELLNKVDSRYRLVILAAKRARELNEGAEKLIDSKSKKATVIALEEIAKGKVAYTDRGKPTEKKT